MFGALLRQAYVLMSTGTVGGGRDSATTALILEIDARSADGLRGLGRAYLAKGEVHEA